MILKTDAIVLRIRGFSNTSQVVTWLSPDAGRLTTLVKGACRGKSAFLGQYDLFYTCELLYYARERDGLHIARECAPLEQRAALRSDWRAMLGAGYVCDALDHVAESSPPGGALYSLLRETLDRLAGAGSSMPLLLWFEVRLLAALGLSPDLAGCPACHGQGGETLRFSVADGRVVCPRCGAGGRNAVVSVSRASLTALRRVLLEPLTAASPFEGFDARELLAMRRFLGVFIRYHLELPLVSRGMAWDVWGMK